MKLVVAVKLVTSPKVSEALRDELRGCNDAATWVSAVAFEHFGLKVREGALRKLVYARLREERRIKSAAAQQLIKKVVDAYTALRGNIRAGNLGGDQSKRRRKAASKPIVFRPDAAQPYDCRNMGWDIDGRSVAITTRQGRLKGVPFVCSPEQARTLSSCRKGEADLLFRDGAWYLHATCEVPEGTLNDVPLGFIGVDLGVENVATTSTGYRAAGRHLNRHRRRQQYLRTKLQKKGTKAAKRLLKKRRRQEARRAKDLNHCISKTIVTEAERTGQGISLEDLTGILGRVRLRKPQRVTLHSWSFHQLGEFIVYKARLAGVPVVYVNPAYTSQMCADCGHTDKRNRVDQGLFICRGCGVVAHADRNASRNIAAKGTVAWDAGRQSSVPAPVLSDGGQDAARNLTASERRSRKLGASIPRS
ncbi:RNA-guided endonuclease InsQ/TnpB family protein [Actinomadura barringtoniae]|uniref:RNA-guided endonuclease InsQ/TnpB family protein n=1 Tax=Actinomadura barringtoniae TaxID=1427535 RepID=UPI0027DC0BE3|nr:transposase [Actinomadura barringtoniae]